MQKFIASKFSLKLTTLTFSTKFSKKRAFLIRNKKNCKYWQFGANLPKKGASSEKAKKWTATLKDYKSYQISASTDNFDFLDQICQKRVFPIKNKKTEHHHWILHVRISVGTKFQLKVTILMFWTELSQKGYFHSKKKKKWAASLNSAYWN